MIRRVRSTERRASSSWLVAGLLLLGAPFASACGDGCGGIEVSEGDSGSEPADAGATDVARADVVGIDTAGADTWRPDTAGTDTIGVDAGGNRTVTLAWDSPTTNADDSCLTDLAGYKLYYGNATGDYGQTVALTLADVGCADTGAPDPGAPSCGNIEECSYTSPELVDGEWFFAVTAYDQSGNESTHSNEVSTVIP